MKVVQVVIAIMWGMVGAAAGQVPNAQGSGSTSSVQETSPSTLSAVGSRVGSPTNQQSDPRAVAIVERAIKAMGGREAWRGAGGAIVDVVIGSTGVSERHVKWTDDWSTGRVQLRRDSSGSEQIKSSIVASDSTHIRMQANGKPGVLLRDNGVAMLAPSYPAEALILSMSKYPCTFEFGKTVNLRIPLSRDDRNESVITERCLDLHYSTGVAVLYWTFSNTGGLPQNVELPVWGQTHHIIRYETVNFGGFQTREGKLIPSRLQIRRMSGSVDTVTINQTTFVESIPNKTFNLGN